MLSSASLKHCSGVDLVKVFGRIDKFYLSWLKLWKQTHHVVVSFMLFLVVVVVVDVVWRGGRQGAIVDCESCDELNMIKSCKLKEGSHKSSSWVQLKQRNMMEQMHWEMNGTTHVDRDKRTVCSRRRGWRWGREGAVVDPVKVDVLPWMSSWGGGEEGGVRERSLIVRVVNELFEYKYDHTLTRLNSELSLWEPPSSFNSYWWTWGKWN